MSRREPPERPGLRYEACTVCGRRWNVSRFARPRGGWYVCPDCAQRERRRR